LNCQIGAILPLQRNFPVQGEQISGSDGHHSAGRPTFDHLAEVLAKRD
jgi:hypothetical protein